jgi:ribosome assembly protein SQT1
MEHPVCQSSDDLFSLHCLSADLLKLANHPHREILFFFARRRPTPTNRPAAVAVPIQHTNSTTIIRVVTMEESDAALPPNDDSLDDDAPEFIDMNDAVEVNVDDDDVPMEDDDDDADDEKNEGDDMDQEGVTSSESVPDQSRLQLTSHTDSVYAVASFLESGQLSILSGGGDDKAFQYKINAVAAQNDAVAQQLPYAHTDTVSSVAFNLQYVGGGDPKKSPRLAAVGSYDGSIIIYDPDTAEQRWKLEGPSDVEWLSFHPKGGSVLLAGSGDGTLWMFHVPLNRCLQVFVGHEQAVTAGAFSPDGKWALSASADGSLRIWAPKTGLNKHVFRLGEAGLTCLATKGGTDGMLVIVGSEDGQAHVCHIGNKKVVAALRHFDPPTGGTAMNADDDDDDDEEIEYPMSVEAVGFSPSQPNWCATGGVDGKLKIWDLTTNGQCRQVCIPPSHTGAAPDSITRLQWHPSLPLVFTASIGGSVRLWDARNGSLIHTLTGGAEQINDMDIQFVPETGAAVIVTASDDKKVRVFDLDVNAVLKTSTAATSL